MRADSRPRGSSWIDSCSASSTGRSYYAPVRSRLDDGGLAAPRSRTPATLGRHRGHCDVLKQLDLAGQHFGHDRRATASNSATTGLVSE